jgi:hypothetical protein
MLKAVTNVSDEHTASIFTAVNTSHLTAQSQIHYCKYKPALTKLVSLQTSNSVKSEITRLCIALNIRHIEDISNANYSGCGCGFRGLEACPLLWLFAPIEGADVDEV